MAYSVAGVITEKHATDTKRIEAAQEAATLAITYYRKLVELGYDAGAARQLTAVWVGSLGQSGGTA